MNGPARPNRNNRKEEGNREISDIGSMAGPVSP
jgi:hypothetical protein